MAEPKPLVINPNSGIATSPFAEGFCDMRNIDIESRPSSARLNFSLQSALPSLVTTTFTANAATDIITTVSSFEYNGHGSGFRAVTVSSSGTLPAGLSAATTYYIIEQTSTTYKLATTLANAAAGTAIDITSAGSGTHTIVSTNMAIAKYMVFDSYNNIYFIQDSIGQIWTNFSSNGALWYLVAGNSLVTANGNGLVLFNNYLIAFRDGAIDVYGNLTTITVGDPTQWTNGWQSIFDGGGMFDHVPFYSPVNGLVYWSEYKVINGSSAVPSGASGLGSLLQVAGKVFLPSDGTTFTFTTGVTAGNFALSLPTYQKITSIILLGSNLMMGTNQNVVYPWDTYSSTFGLPVILPEQNVTSMANIGNILYIACGLRGNLYIYDGYSTKKIGQVPPYISGIPQNVITISNLIKHNGKLYFNVGCKGCSGVWSINPNTGVIILENSVSNGNYGTFPLTMGVLYSAGNDILFCGWFDVDSSTYGFDTNRLLGNYYQSGYTAYLETTFYNAGTPNSPRTLANFDFLLGAVLQSGQGIKIYAREDNLTAYPATPEATFDFATFGAIDSVKLPFGKSFIGVQFKIYITTGANNTTTPQLNFIYIN